jgi:hypothetical protein
MALQTALDDIDDADPLGVQLKRNPKIEILIDGYNRIAAKSGVLDLVRTENTGADIKRFIGALPMNNQLKILHAYVNSDEDQKKDSEDFRLRTMLMRYVNKIVTVVVVGAIVLSGIDAWRGGDPNDGIFATLLNNGTEILKLLVNVK